jgi:hypothetical protein
MERAEKNVCLPTSETRVKRLHHYFASPEGIVNPEARLGKRLVCQQWKLVATAPASCITGGPFVGLW